MPADHSNHRQSTHSSKPLPRPSDGLSSNELHQVITSEKLREAERTLKSKLGAKVPRLWVTEHAQEALGQALVEYQQWQQTNVAHNPVGWLITCSYWRALNLYDSERRGPNVDSLDTIFHVADEKTATPEQEAIEHDRQERLDQAMSNLPEKETELLALVYREEDSIREAGRKVGWQKSAADRHHDAAIDKMRAQVGHLDL